MDKTCSKWIKLDKIVSKWLNVVQNSSNWFKIDQNFHMKGFFGHGMAIHIFGYWTAINILGYGNFLLGDNLDFGKLGVREIWATWTLGNLSFGWLGLWATWTLNNLGDLSFGQLEWLELWEIFELWLLGKLCIEKLDSRFNGWKYFRLVEKKIETWLFWKTCFFSRPFWTFFQREIFLFALFLWKSIKGSWISRMEQNFDNYPDFQPKNHPPQTFQPSVCILFLRSTNCKKILTGIVSWLFF